MSAPALTPDELRAERERWARRHGITLPKRTAASVTATPSAAPWTMADLSREAAAAGVEISAGHLATMAGKGRLAGAYRSAVGSQRRWMIAPEAGRRWIAERARSDEGGALSAYAVAARAGVSRDVVRGAIRRGELTGRRVPSGYQFSVAEADRWIATLPPRECAEVAA